MADILKDTLEREKCAYEPPRPDRYTLAEVMTTFGPALTTYGSPSAGSRVLLEAVWADQAAGMSQFTHAKVSGVGREALQSLLTTMKSLVASLD